MSRNPRWLAYCASHGRSHEEQLAYDRERWPGGCMAGFMLWVRVAWQRWAEASKEKRPGYDQQGGWTSEQHRQFDLWLDSGAMIGVPYVPRNPD